ncbi:MAG: DUF1761 domain-containing protein [bacterium]
MQVNYCLVLVSSVAGFVLGALWYSPLLFGKIWMEIMECTNIPPEEMKKMQKEMMPFYALQLFLAFFTTVSFANLVPYVTAFSIYHLAFWIWIGFMAPIQIGCVIWANTKKKYWLKQILVMISFQLAVMMLTAWILSM